MADKTYTIPLRKAWLKTPKHKRAKKAVNATRAYLQKHLKTDIIKLSTILNNHLWAKGMRNPPSRVTVSVTKDKDSATATLPDIKKKPSLMQTRSKLAVDKKEKAKQRKEEEKKKAAAKKAAEAAPKKQTAPTQDPSKKATQPATKPTTPKPKTTVKKAPAPSKEKQPSKPKDTVRANGA